MRFWVMPLVSTLRSVVPSSTLASFWMSSALTWSLATASMEVIWKVEVLLSTRNATPRTAATMATATTTRITMPMASAVRTCRARASLASLPLWGRDARCGCSTDGRACAVLGAAAGLGVRDARDMRGAEGCRVGRGARARDAEEGRDGRVERVERPCVDLCVALREVGLLLSFDAMPCSPYAPNPSSLTSGWRSISYLSRTASWTWRMTSTTSCACAPPSFTMKLAWTSETTAPPTR